MSSLLTARDAWVAALLGHTPTGPTDDKSTATTLTGVHVYTHGGSFNQDELARFSRMAPALVLALLRIDADREAGVVTSEAHWGLVAFTKDTKTVARDRSCIALVEAATNVILSTWAGDGVRGRGHSLMARNMFSGPKDAEQTVAMWGIQFTQTLDLVEEIDTDAFLRMGLTWDLEPQDATLGEIPEAEDLVEPEQ